MMVGKVRINSSSRNYIFHRTTCRYVQGEARNGYFIHLDQDVAVERGYRPCYVCFPEAKKAQKQGRLDEDDNEWELTGSESTENEGCSKMCTWCETRKCTRKKPDHVHCYCSCTECIRKYTEDLWRGQYDKVPEQSSSSQGPTGKKGCGTLEYMPPHVHSKRNRPAGQGKTGKRGRAAVEGRIEPTIPELNESLTQEGTPEEEQAQVYEDMYEESMYDGLVDPGTPDSTEARTDEALIPASRRCSTRLSQKPLPRRAARLSFALTPALAKACAVQLAYGIYAAFGFAPTRLNTPDPPSRNRPLEDPGGLLLSSCLPPETVHGLGEHHFHRPLASWARLVLVAVLSEGPPSQPVRRSCWPACCSSRALCPRLPPGLRCLPWFSW